jgi:hypothetical protein
MARLGQQMYEAEKLTDVRSGTVLLRRVTDGCFDNIGEFCGEDEDVRPFEPCSVGEAWQKLFKQDGAKVQGGFDGKECMLDLASQLEDWANDFDNYGINGLA